MKRFVLTLLFILLPLFVAHARMVSITGEKVNLRSGPGTKYAVVWELGKGFPLQVIESKGNWLKVKDFENDVGWVYRNLVSGKAHLIVKVNKQKNKRINIRSGPGTKYGIVGKANYGVVFQTLEHRQSWVKVKHEDGLIGWVKRSLLWGW